MARKPSYAELTALIEQSDTYPEIQAGEVEQMCAEYTADYAELFSEQDIDHLSLTSQHHCFMAVDTADAGVVIFDPTFRQYFPDYPKPYFLGSPETLYGYLIHAEGKRDLDRTIQTVDWYEPEPGDDMNPNVTPRSAYFYARIEAPFFPTDEGRAAQEAFLQHWSTALRPIKPAMDSVAMFCDQPPSFAERVR